jgi:hypothetical protein
MLFNLLEGKRMATAKPKINIGDFSGLKARGVSPKKPRRTESGADRVPKDAQSSTAVPATRAEGYAKP